MYVCMRVCTCVWRVYVCVCLHYILYNKRRQCWQQINLAVNIFHRRTADDTRHVENWSLVTWHHDHALCVQVTWYHVTAAVSRRRRPVHVQAVEQRSYLVEFWVGSKVRPGRDMDLNTQQRHILALNRPHAANSATYIIYVYVFYDFILFFYFFYFFSWCFKFTLCKHVRLSYVFLINLLTYLSSLLAQCMQKSVLK